MERILPNFVYALLITRSRLGLLSVIFRKFVAELWPLIGVRFSFPLERTEFHQILYHHHHHWVLIKV